MTALTLDIGVDIDDVLFPWSVSAHAACELAGITNGKVISQWEAWQDYGCTAQEFWDVLHAAYLDGMLLKSDPMPGVRSALEGLGLMGRVHLVTARGFEGPLAKQVRENTREWLDSADLFFDTLTFTKDKTTVKADYFLDDSISNVTALRGAGVEAYLHTQDHNAAAPAHLPRVKDIREFSNIIERESLLMAECK